MRKRFGHKKYFLIPVGIYLAPTTVAFLIYSQFEAVKDRSIVDISVFAPTLVLLVIQQGLFSVGIRKPWILLPFVVWVGMIAAYFSSFEFSGPVSLQYLRYQHMNQIVHLKMAMAAIVPTLNAVACHVYLRRKNQENVLPPKCTCAECRNLEVIC